MSTGAPDPAIGAVHRVAVALIALGAVTSVVSWRSDAIFTGTVDTVVVAKAVLSTAALAAAVALWAMTSPRRPLGVRSTLLLALILGVSLVGSLAAGSSPTTAVVVVRVAILAVLLLALLGSTPWRVVLGSLLGAMGTVAVVAAATGASSYLTTGRLAGGIPEVQENELAGLAALPLLGLVVLLLRDGIRWYLLVPAVVLAGIVWATQSRTALLALGIAVIVALVVTPHLHWTAAVALFASIPIGFAVAAYTSVVADVVVRGQTASEIGTLSARTDAWKVVFESDLLSWQRWIGLGLSVKVIEVDLPYRETQVFDSSWVSVIAQAGIVGFVLFLAWTGSTLLDAARDRDERFLMLPLIVMLLVRGLTENGLVDASAAFLVLFAISVAAEPRSRTALAPAAVAHAAFARLPARYTPVPATTRGAIP